MEAAIAKAVNGFGRLFQPSPAACILDCPGPVNRRAGLMSAAPLMIAGLGNPGARYAKNRHNIGFRAVDAIASRLGVDPAQKKWKSLYGSAKSAAGGELVLIKPQDFMNNSGECVAPAAKFFKIPVSQLLVLHDESELPFGELRFKQGGGHKGHNGLRDLIDQFGDPGFHRLRIGVGRPEDRGLADYLLANFTAEEEAALPPVLERVVEMSLQWIEEQSK